MSRERDAGFSLLELIVALTILAMVLTTAYRIAGDVVAAAMSRERAVRLTSLAEAAWQELRLSGSTNADAITFAWPDDVELEIEEIPLPEAGLSEDGPLRALRLRLSRGDEGEIEISGVIRTRSGDRP